MRINDFTRLFESSDINVGALKEYLSRFTQSYSGELTHGAYLKKLYQEFEYGFFWSSIPELGETDDALFSTSLNSYNALRFFSDNSGVIFEASDLRVTRLPMWLVGILGKETGAGWYDEHKEEINEMAPKFNFPKCRFNSSEYRLPDSFLTRSIESEAYTMFTNDDFSIQSGNEEDEISVCWSLAKPKLRVTSVLIKGEEFDSIEEAVSFIRESYSEDELANDYY